MQPNPALRALALALLPLGALLAVAPAADAATCTVSDPKTCCELLGLNCNFGCSNPLEPVCCLLDTPTDPLACCPPPVACKCPPVVPEVCCLLQGGPLTCLCDPVRDPLGCCPTTVACRCPPAVPEACCLLDAGPRACLCDPARDPLECCPDTLLSCQCAAPAHPDPCCLVRNPGHPEACGDTCESHPTVPLPPCDPSPCVAVGLLVTETDALGGASRNAFAESRIDSLTAAPGTYTPPPGPAPRAPPSAMVHADAKLAGAQYSNGLVDVAARTVFSQCDANAVDDPAGRFADTYGRGGVEDLHLTVLGQALDLAALSFEMQAFGGPGGSTAAWHCDLAEAGLNTPHPAAAAAVCQPAASLGTGTVNVWYNEVNGPTYDPVSGATRHWGSHLHVQVNAGAATVDLYVGYVQVAVPSAPAPLLPATYLPHGPCLLVCT